VLASGVHFLELYLNVGLFIAGKATGDVVLVLFDEDFLFRTSIDGHAHNVEQPLLLIFLVFLGLFANLIQLLLMLNLAQDVVGCCLLVNLLLLFALLLELLSILEDLLCCHFYLVFLDGLPHFVFFDFVSKAIHGDLLLGEGLLLLDVVHSLDVLEHLLAHVLALQSLHLAIG
jgi:hypothetical protein